MPPCTTDGAAARLASAFAARSVAIVGASPRPGNWGGRRVRQLSSGGYRGRVYPVNRTGADIGEIKGYKSVSDIPDAVDLAILAVRPEDNLAALADCVRAKVRAVVAVSLGFAESGDQGLAIETETERLIAQSGICYLGPNCIGFADTSTGLDCYFDTPLPRGRLSILSQGGGMAVYMSELARARGIGISKFVTLGNQLQVDLLDGLDYLAHDPETDAIVVYVEGAPRTRQRGFMRTLVERIAGLMDTKPVVAMHCSGGRDGAALAYSHTASLAANRTLFAGACKQHRVLWTGSPGDAVAIADHLGRLRRMPIVRNACLVASGSQGMFLAETCDDLGLPLPALAPEHVAVLTEQLKGHVVALTNPLDLGAISTLPGLLQEVLAYLTGLDRYDAIVYPVPVSDHLERLPDEQVAELARRFASLATSGKLLVGIEWLGRTTAAFRAALVEAGHLMPESPEQAVRVLATLARRGVPRART